jgi:DNA-binding beta-propeller fold protein YncE
MTTGQALRYARRTGFALIDFLAGSPEIRMGAPHGISVDETTLAIADSGRMAVHLLHLKARRYRVIEDVGRTALRCPIGAAPDGAGGVFVSDSVLARVFHLSATGRLDGEIQGEFVRPTGLAYDAARRVLHVVDTGSHTVFSFQREGEAPARVGAVREPPLLLRRLGHRGEGPGPVFNFPTHAALDRAGNLYVADSLNFRVRIFSPEGNLVGTFGRVGDGTGDFAKPKGIAIDSEGHIYVVDSQYDVIQVFNRDGRFLLSFGGSGREEGLLWLPTGIFIDGQDRIYVADSGNSRVQVYQYLRETPVAAGPAPSPVGGN